MKQDRNKQNELIRMSIIRDMSEGVIVLGLNGIVEYINPAAESILKKSAEKPMRLL